MNKKKLLALLMALVMTLTLVPVTALAEGETLYGTVTVNSVTTEFYREDYDDDEAVMDAIAAEVVGKTSADTISITLEHDFVIPNFTRIYGSNQQLTIGDKTRYAYYNNRPTVIFDLNGHKIRYTHEDTSTGAFGIFNCDMVLKDTRGGGSIISDGCLWGVMHVGNSIITVEGGTLASYSTAWGNLGIGLGTAGDSVWSANAENTSGSDMYAPGQIVIKGGTIVGMDDNDIWQDYIEAVPEGYEYEFTTYENNKAFTVTAPAPTSVAQIGETKYETLAAAAAAVADGQTIVMLNDVTEEDEIVFDHNNAAFTLDLAGHTVTVNNDIWAKNGHLTLTSSVAGGKVADGQNGAAIYVSSNYNNAQGTLTIDSDNVTVEGGQWGIAFMSNSVVNINAGTVKAVSTVENKDSYGISGNGNSTGAQVNISGGNVTGNTLGVYFPGSNALNISGGTISGEVGVYVKPGTTTITGGTINGTGDKRDYSYYGNGGRSTGDAVVIDNCNYPSGAPSASIKGATITSANGKQIGYYVYESSDEGTVVADKAYSLSTNVPAKGWVANSGENADNYPKTIGTPTAVAKVGDVEYGTLAAAIAAANENGGTVTLLRNYDMEANEPGYGYTTAYYAYGEDTTRDNMIEIKDGVTLDLNSCTLSNLYNNTFNVTGDNVTFQNGTMLLGQLYYDKSKGTYSYGSYIVYVTGAQNFTVRNMTASGINVANGSTATMEGLTFRGYGFYAVCAQVNSTVTLSGGTYDKAEAGKANYLFWIEDGSTMNITGGNYITGTSAFKTSSSVNPVITGGTFDFDPTNKGVADGYEAVALTGANTGKWQVGKVKATELTLDTTAQNDNTTATYTATKSVVDESGELIPGTTEEATITVTVSTIAEQAAPTTTEKAYEPAQLSNIKVDEVVAVAVDKADDEGNTKAEVVVQLAKDAGNVDTENKKVTYEVHPEAIITVKNDQNETVGAPTTVALTNDQIQGTFSFKLFVPTDVAAAGDTVTVTHIHEDGTEENLGVFTVEDGNVITIRNIKEFSYFGVSATATVQTDSGAHFAYLGASLRRRVKTNNHDIVVNTSTDIRFTYEIKNYDPNLNYYFQWKKGADGEWSNAVAITDFSGSNASLVINNVPSGAFDMELFTRIYVQDGDNVYMLSNEGNGINRSVEQVATALRDGSSTPDKWKNYAKFLLNDGVTQYLISENS